MKPIDKDLLERIKVFVDNFCDTYSYGPTVREIADEFEISTSRVFRYLNVLKECGELDSAPNGRTESSGMDDDRRTVKIMKLGYVPCGPLQDITSYYDGSIRLPRSLVGPGQFFCLEASGTSMVKAGIDDGDMVIIRQQPSAEIGDIVVALVDNEVTLKRLAQDDDGVYYLHPENPRFKDIYVDNMTIQGVVTKIIKDVR